MGYRMALVGGRVVGEVQVADNCCGVAFDLLGKDVTGLRVIRKTHAIILAQKKNIDLTLLVLFEMLRVY
jgi:hypothetical protein